MFDIYKDSFAPVVLSKRIARISKEIGNDLN
jgi:hypothetical protein